MDQTTKNALRSIPVDALLQDGLETMANGMARMAEQIESMLGPQAARSLTPIVGRMQRELQTKFLQRVGFRAMFSGQGDKARKLREFVNLGDALCGEPDPGHTRRFERLLGEFSHELTNQPAEIAHWEALKLQLSKLLSQREDTTAPVLVYEGVKAGFEERTGFFVEAGTLRGTVKHLVLAGTMPESEVVFVLRASTFDPPVVVLWHPLECSWVQMPDDYLLQGITAALSRELKSAEEELDASCGDRDWPEVFEALSARAAAMLSGPARHLPPVMRAFARDKNSPEVQEIKLVHNNHTLLLRHTGGKWTSFTAEVYTGSMESMAFTRPFADLETSLQKQLVVALERELNWLDQQLPHHAPRHMAKNYGFSLTHEYKYQY